MTYCDEVQRLWQETIAHLIYTHLVHDPKVTNRMNRSLLAFAKVTSVHGVISEAKVNVLRDRVWVGEEHVVLVLVHGETERLAGLL